MARSVSCTHYIYIKWKLKTVSLEINCILQTLWLQDVTQLLLLALSYSWSGQSLPPTPPEVLVGLASLPGEDCAVSPGTGLAGLSALASHLVHNLSGATRRAVQAWPSLSTHASPFLEQPLLVLLNLVIYSETSSTIEDLSSNQIWVWQYCFLSKLCRVHEINPNTKVLNKFLEFNLAWKFSFTIYIVQDTISSYCKA